MAKLSRTARRHVNRARAMSLLAANLTEAVEEMIIGLPDLLDELDGAPRARTYDGMPRGTGAREGLTPVEAAGVARAHRLLEVEQILDDVDSICQMIDDTTSMVARVTGRPQVVKHMCSGGVGRPGWGEWGADSCDRMAVTADRELCDRHRIAEWRWRVRSESVESA